MCDITVLLDSSKLTNQDSDNYEVYLSRPLELKNYPHEIAMKSLYTWFTWFNIHKADYDNATFRYYNGTAWKQFDIPNGNYNAEELNDAIHEGMEALTDVIVDVVTGEKTYNINIVPVYSQIKMKIQIANSFQVDLTISRLNELLGFTQAIVNATSLGSSNANITNGVNTMVLHCNICSGSSYDNSNASDILYTFVPSVPPGSNISITPSQPVYVPIDRMDRIDRIGVKLTDQRGRKISLNGENMTVWLHIRPRKVLQVGGYNSRI